MYDTSLLNSSSLQLFSAQELPESEEYFLWLATLAGFLFPELLQSSLEHMQKFSLYKIFWQGDPQPLICKVFQVLFIIPGSDVHNHLGVCRASKILSSSVIKIVLNTLHVGKSEPSLLHIQAVSYNKLWQHILGSSAKQNTIPELIACILPEELETFSRHPLIPPYTKIHTHAELEQ